MLVPSEHIVCKASLRQPVCALCSAAGHDLNDDLALEREHGQDHILMEIEFPQVCRTLACSCHDCAGVVVPRTLPPCFHLHFAEFC